MEREMTQQELKKECKDRQRITDAYIKQHYGNSIGPRRRSHWEVRGGGLCLVED